MAPARERLRQLRLREGAVQELRAAAAADNRYRLRAALAVAASTHEVGEADLLGIIVLRAREFDREGGFSGTLNLRGCGHGHEGKITVKVLILPPMVEEAPPVSMLGSRLKVTVFAAKNLRAADWAMGGGKSDPFCAEIGRASCRERV